MADQVSVRSLYLQFFMCGRRPHAPEGEHRKGAEPVYRLRTCADADGADSLCELSVSERTMQGLWCRDSGAGVFM